MNFISGWLSFWESGYMRNIFWEASTAGFVGVDSLTVASGAFRAPVASSLGVAQDLTVAGGSFDPEITLAPERATVWTTPRDAGVYPLWVVVRDGHLGTSGCRVGVVR
mgnify:CR=1 FL=1